MAHKYMFHRDRSRSNPYRVFVMLVLILGGLSLLRGYGAGQVEEAFRPTPTPTRTTASYSFEGQTHFQAGDLNKAIAAYKAALVTNPNDAELWLELAQIQTYSSNLLTTNAEQLARLKEALVSANKAVEVGPDNSSAHAVLAFVLDWNASLTEQDKERQALLIQAEQAVTKASELDQNNTLALAYAAEIYNDEIKPTLAQKAIDQAKAQNPNLMDVQRVRGQILERLGDYQGAIDAYNNAIQLAPNLTFLYIRVGVIYRYLGMTAKSEPIQKQYYNQALDILAKVVALNKQLGIEDPTPYVAIGKVYTQMGEFFIASRNAKKALQINPVSPDLYGQLAMVYFKARNYETSIPAFQCAVEGCGPEISCQVRDDCGDPNVAPVTIAGIELKSNDAATIVYYYTYGSVLAGLYRPVGETNGYCARALQVLAKVRAVAGKDAAIMSIVSTSESICASASPVLTSPTPLSGATPTGGAANGATPGSPTPTGSAPEGPLASPTAPAKPTPTTSNP